MAGDNCLDQSWDSLRCCGASGASGLKQKPLSLRNIIGGMTGESGIGKGKGRGECANGPRRTGRPKMTGLQFGGFSGAVHLCGAKVALVHGLHDVNGRRIGAKRSPHLPPHQRVHGAPGCFID
jgi:hypothetical protein